MERSSSELEEKKAKFERIFGFSPINTGTIVTPLETLRFKKQTEMVYLVMRALARAWQLACYEEEQYEREIKDTVLVFEEQRPEEFNRLWTLKKKVITTRSAFGEAVVIADVFKCAGEGNVLVKSPGYYGSTMQDDPQEYIKNELKQLREKFDASHPTSVSAVASATS